MKKLHLELSDLKVDSFETTRAVAGRGTVDAHASPRCFTNLTCDPTTGEYPIMLVPTVTAHSAVAPATCTNTRTAGTSLKYWM